MEDRKTEAAKSVEKWKRDVETSYDNQSADYDVLRSKHLNAQFFFDVSYRRIDELLGELPESAVHIEMPVGTGRFAFYLREHGREHKIIGLDVSEGMLKVARKIGYEEHRNVPLSYGDAFQLPLADNSVDALTSLRFFHLFPTSMWPVLLEEMYRVLRPGGFLIAEMRNIFRFGAWALIKEYRDRWFNDDQPHSFIVPHRVKTYFRDWDILEARGVGLDGLAQLSVVAPGVALKLTRVSNYSPFKYVTKELVIKARKPV